MVTSLKEKPTVSGNYMLPEQPPWTLAMFLLDSETLLEGLKILPEEIPLTKPPERQTAE